MQRIGILLLGMASLVASGVILDRGRVALNTAAGLGLQTVQGIRGGIGGDILTHDELMRQKVVLDILHQVELPLQNQELAALDDRQTITNENLYIRPLTQEMHLVLDMIRNNQMIDRQTVWIIHNDQHIRQMVGLYRLMVTARDFDTLLRLIVHARRNINTEMFVNCLVLALSEREDTQMLIVPALHEILPQVYHEDRVIQHVRNLDTGISTLRPQLLDLVSATRQQGLWNSQQQQRTGGLWDVLNRSQMWMPWRELHKQLAWRKLVGGGNVQREEQLQSEKLVISLPGQGLLTEDLDLKAHVNILVDELIVNQDKIRNTIRDQDISGHRGTWGRRGQLDVDDILGGIRRNRDDDENEDDHILLINSQRRNNLGLRQGGMIDSVRDRVVNQGGSRLDIDNDMDRRRILLGGRRRLDNDDDEDVTGLPGRRWGGRLDNERDTLGDRQQIGGRGQDLREVGGRRRLDNDDEDVTGLSGRRWGGRLDNERDTLAERQQIGGRGQDLHEEQRGINTVSVNDARLLFVGRRRKNPNNVVDLSGRNTVHDEDTISGGRRVEKDQRQRTWQDNRDDDDDDIRRINKINRRGGLWQNNDDEDDYLIRGMNRRNIGLTRQRQIDIDDEDIIHRQGLGVNVGRGRDDFLNVVRGGRVGQQRQLWNRNQNQIVGHRSLDQDLPTTTIDDERLLHVNRRRLNDINDGRRVRNRLVDLDEQDDDDEDVLQQHRILGNQRGNRNMQWTRLDEQRNWQRDNILNVDRRVNQDRREENQQRLGVDSTTGRRYRRSLDTQQRDIDRDMEVTGKLLLHTLQQLVARLNIERISLGLPQLVEDLQSNNQIRTLLTNNGINSHLDMITRGRHTGLQGVDVQTVHKIENLIQRIDEVLQQRVGDISVMQHDEQINEIGLILAGQIQEVGLIELLREVLQRPQGKGQIANVIENEAVQILLAGIVKVVDRRVQQVFRKRQEFISTVRGVTIHNVEVDRLQTHMELADIDLSNLLSQNLEDVMRGHHQEVVGRVPRLNHRDFNIQVDVTSDRQQQVVVRNLLVPKVDGQGRTIPLRERRQNVIVMDITTVELQPGHNTLNLRSNDITLTARDTTPLSEIYQHVMQALRGNTVVHKDLLVGQTNLLPHRLLLPRGRINGLPMQLITVITPVETVRPTSIHQRQNGLDLLLLDRLPLNYPLHCDLTDLDRVVTMPNLMVKDVKIYHDNQIRNLV